tara:strand:+ start:224 stop:442 length:219 start_codon:yes stop_codon:yes gene_type:complete
MYLSSFAFNGYAIFVCSAFLFTFLCCTYLFIKTKKELKKQEQLFSRELEALQVEKIAIAASDRKIKKIYQLS